MPKTFPRNTRRTGETYRLRKDVFESLAKGQGADTKEKQAELVGISRATLHRIFSGYEPSLSSAMQMSEALKVPLPALLERVKEAA